MGDVSDTVLYEAAGGVATLTLNRPDRMNAITTELLDRLLFLAEEVASDEAVRVVVLTGAGRGFCPGADLALLAEGGSGEPQPLQRRTGNSRRWMRISELFREMPKITVAAVNGPCAGAGLSWALACDLRVAARSAVFRTAFAAVGASGDYGVNWLLPRVVGWGRARELLFLNEKIGADDALRLGLVAKVVDDGELLAEVGRVVDGLLAMPAAGLLGIKQNLLDAESTSLAEELNLESERLSRTLGTPESVAAARAQLRPPT